MSGRQGAGRTRRMLRAMGSIFRIQLAEGLQYRLAALSGAAISVFWCLIEITVLSVFFLHGDRAGAAGIGNGMTLRQAVSYQWLSQFLCVMGMVGLGGDILGKIDSGDVGIELCRPLSLYSHWFAKNTASRVAPLFLRGTLILLTGLALAPFSIGLLPPAGLGGFVCALASACLAVLLCSAYSMLVCVVRLNVNQGNGPMHMLLLLSQVLSGAFLPLQLWPDALQPFLLVQPFAGTLDLPVRLYHGLLQPADALWVMALQAGWTLLFIALGRWSMGRRLRRIVVQGG